MNGIIGILIAISFSNNLNNMKNLFKLICIIVLTLSINSCGVQFRYNTLNTAGYVDTLRSEGYAVEEINTVSQLRWKLRTDFAFSNDYYFFLNTQPYSFFQNQYYQNRLYRWGWRSPLDYYLNWQWSWNSGYTYWSPFNQYPWYGNWHTNYWWNWQNNYPFYSQVYGPRTTYLGNVYGRRGFANTIQQNRQTNRKKPRVVQNQKPRIILNNNGTIPNQRPSNTIRVKPPTNNRPTYNRPSNSRPPVYNNNRPSNSNTRPVITKPNRPVSTPRSNSKRGGQ